MTAAVTTETGARGRLSETVLTVVVLADLVLLVLFSFAMLFARVAVGATTSDGVSLLARFTWEIGGAVAFGVFVGARIDQSSSSSSSVSSSRDRPVQVMNTLSSVGGWPCSRATRSTSSSGVPSATTRPSLRIADPVAQPLGLGEVVRREHDGRVVGCPGSPR